MRRRYLCVIVFLPSFGPSFTFNPFLYSSFSAFQLFFFSAFIFFFSFLSFFTGSLLFFILYYFHFPFFLFSFFFSVCFLIFLLFFLQLLLLFFLHFFFLSSRVLFSFLLSLSLSLFLSSTFFYLSVPAYEIFPSLFPSFAGFIHVVFLDSFSFFSLLFFPSLPFSFFFSLCLMQFSPFLVLLHFPFLPLPSLLLPFISRLTFPSTNFTPHRPLSHSFPPFPPFFPSPFPPPSPIHSRSPSVPPCFPSPPFICSCHLNYILFTLTSFSLTLVTHIHLSIPTFRIPPQSPSPSLPSPLYLMHPLSTSPPSKHTSHSTSQSPRPPTICYHLCGLLEALWDQNLCLVGGGGWEV